MEITARFEPFGIDLFCLGRKFLVLNLVSRNIKVKYRRSILGLMWTLAGPLAMAMIYYFVFKVILNIQIPHYLVFMLGGVLPWNFFSQTISEGLESIVGNWGLASKVPIPIQVFPWVGALTNLVTLGLALPVLIGAALLSHAPVGASLIALLPFFILLFFMSYGFSLILAIFFVFFRDLRHILSIFLQLWFYGTPVIYSETMIPPKYQWVVFANPLGTMFVAIHRVLTTGQWPTVEHWIISLGWTIVVMVAALLLQRRCGTGLVEQI